MSPTKIFAGDCSLLWYLFYADIC